jgi:hypothetical protein
MIIHEMARKIVADRMTGFRLVPQKRHGDVWRLCHRASHRSESVGFGFYVSNFGSSRPTARWPGSSCSCCGVAHQPCPAVGAELDAELERGRPLQAGMHAEHELQLPPKAPASWKRTKPPRTRTSNSDADYAALETPRVKPTLRVSPGARVQSKSMITNHYRRNRAWGPLPMLAGVSPAMLVRYVAAVLVQRRQSRCGTQQRSDTCGRAHVRRAKRVARHGQEQSRYSGRCQDRCHLHKRRLPAVILE